MALWLYSTPAAPQIPAYSLLLAAAYGLVQARGAPAGAWRFLSASLAGGILGVGLSSILLLPHYVIPRGCQRRWAFVQHQRCYHKHVWKDKPLPRKEGREG